MMRTALLALAATTAAAAALAACSPQASNDAAPAKKPAPPAPVVAGALPPPPAWAQPFMGKIITKVLPQKEICAGNTDHRGNSFAGPPTGSEVGGWGWDKEAKRPVARILLTDETLRVWGAAENAGDRPDVMKNLPEVQDPHTGWRGFAAATSGLVVAYGLVEDGRAICPLGEMEL